MTQYYSRIDTTLNGDVYNIPFSYMKESEISVYINDEPITAWEFLNESQIKINEMPSEIPAGAIVSIRRTTDITKKVVDYTNQSMLNKDNLNLSQDQVLNAVQEVYDNEVKFEFEINETFQNTTNAINQKIYKHVEDSDSKFESLTNRVSTAENSIENRAVEILNSIDLKGNNIKNEVIANGQYWNEVVADHNLLYDEVEGDTNSLEIPSNQYVTQARDSATSASNSAQKAATSATSASADAQKAATSANNAATIYNNISKETTNSVNTINTTKNSVLIEINNRGQYWNEKVADHNLLYDEISEDGIEIATTHYVELAQEQANIATAKANEVITNGNAAVNNINTTKTNAISDINSATTSATNQAINSIISNGEYWVQKCADNNLFYEVVGNVDIIID